MGNLFELVEEVFEIDGHEYSDETIINEIKTWDSLRHMEFIVSVESTFQITLTGDEIAALRTIRDIKDLLTAKGKGNDFSKGHD